MGVVACICLFVNFQDQFALFGTFLETKMSKRWEMTKQRHVVYCSMAKTNVFLKWKKKKNKNETWLSHEVNEVLTTLESQYDG